MPEEEEDLNPIVDTELTGDEVAVDEAGEARRKEVSEIMDGILDEKGVNPTNLLMDYHNVSREVNPERASGLEDEYKLPVMNGDQDWSTDLIEGIYKTFVVNTIEGFGNLIPTVAQAFGAGDDEKLSFEENAAKNKKEKEWSSTWINAVSGFTKSISPRYSDKYYQERADGDLFSSRSIAVGLGEGLGFVGGIIFGGGAIAKGAVKTIGLATAAKVGARTTRNANRVGSFIMGTNLMYPMVYDEAIKAEIKPAHAARLALGIAGIVSMTEGAALEWMGKGLVKPVLNKASKKVLQNELRSIGAIRTLDDAALETAKVVTGFGNSMRAMGGAMVEGSAIEMGQEFSQTYIEEGLKQTYDHIWGKGKTEHKGKFGADIGFGPGSTNSDKARWDTFKHASFGAMIGGIIGGGVPIVGSHGRLMEQETLYGFINQNIKQGKPKNIRKIDKLFSGVKDMAKRGVITEEMGVQATKHLTNMLGAAHVNNKLGINDGVASLQLYQMNALSKEITKEIDSKFKEDENLTGAVAAAYRVNRDMGLKINEAINADMADMIENKENFGTNKTKFEKRLSSYQNLADSISEMSEEELDKALTDIKNDSKFEKKRQKAEKNKKQSAAQLLAEAENKVKIEELEQEKEKEIAKVTDQFIEDGDVAKKEKALKEIEEKYDASIKELELAAVELDEEVETPEEAEARNSKAKETKKQAEEEKEVNVNSSLSDEQLNQKKKSIQRKIDELGDTPNVFSLERFGNEMALVEAEINKRDEEDVANWAQEFKQGKRDTEKETQKQRQKRLSDKAKSRKRRKARDQKTKVKKKKGVSRDMKVVDENNVEYNGQEYTIETDSGNNIVALNSPGKTITNEKVLIQAEIERNKLEFTDPRTNKEVVEAIKEETNTSFDEEMAIDNLLSNNLTDEISEVLAEGLPEEVSIELIESIDEYIEKTTDLLLENFPKSEWAETMVEALIELKTEIDERYETEYGTKGEIQTDAQETSTQDTKTEEQVEEEIRTDDQIFKDSQIDLRKENDPSTVVDTDALSTPEDIANTIEEAKSKNLDDVGKIDDAIDFLANQFQEVLDLLKPTSSRVELGIYSNELLSKKTELQNTLDFLTDYKSAIQSDLEIDIPSFEDYNALRTQPEEIQPQAVEEATEEITDDLVDEKGQISMDLDFKDHTKEESFEEFMNEADVAEEVDPKLKNDKNTDEQIKEQKEFPNSTIQDKISENPKLYKKIKKHFRKIFPNISVAEVDKIISQYGAQALARVVEKGIEIDSSLAFQHSIIHEYAHIYIKTLGKNNPLVKAGLEFIVGTQFYEDAKVMYAHLTEAEIREEALAEAMAVDSYNKLKVKFDGTTLEKFMAISKRIWAKIKSNFTKAKGNDIVSIIADGMTFRNSPIQHGSEFLTGMNKDQLINPTQAELTSFLSAELTTLRIDKIINPEKSFDPRSVNSVTMNAYKALMGRYIKEKSLGPKRIADDTTKLFDNISIDLKQEESIQDTRENIISFYKMMKEDMPFLFGITNNTIESISRVPVPKLEEVTDSVVKADQKMSESARAVVTSMVDYEGNIISPDNIDRYVANLSTNTLGAEGFQQGLREDAKDPNNIEAKRLNDMLANMSKGVRQSIVNELSSLIQIEHRSTIVRKDGESVTITHKVVNSDESLKTEKKELLQNLEEKPKSEKLLNWRRGNREAIENREVKAMELARQTIENAFDITLPWVQFNEYVDNMIGKKGNKKAFSNFLWSLGDVLNKTKPVGEINSYTQELVKLSSDKQLLQKTFTNSKGNSVSSTRFGYWISELNSLMANQDNYLQEMKDSKLYRSNPIVKQLLKTKGQKQEWFVHDAINNSILNKVTEYGKQVNSDTIINGLSFFSNVASPDYYYQSIGISGNRDHVTYFKAPRYKSKEALQNQYAESVDAEQMVFDNEVKELKENSKEYNDVVKKFNGIYMNKVVDGVVVTPWDSAYPAKHTKDNKAKIKAIKDMVQENGMTEAIQKDHVTKKKTYGNIDDLIEDYFYTESINREALMDMYSGVPLHRKNIEAAIKRGSGPNSGGSKIEFDKPVMIVAYKVPSKKVTKNPNALTSDSFTVDSPNLHAHIVEQSGDLGKVGANKKDFVFQVNRKNGNTQMMKMSTIGITVNQDGTNNLNEMGNGYSRMGDAVIKAEEYFAKKGKDKSPYIKFVDSEVLKGNEGNYTVVPLENLLAEIENDKFDLLENASFEQEISNYRVAFNLNKDLTKVPLSEQSVILSTQLSKIVLNYATPEELRVFENAIVDSLKQKLGVKGDNYSDGKTYQKLKETKSFIDGLINSAGEQKANSISSLINSIAEYNESNPNEQIKIFDDPNLVNLVQQFVATKLTKDGLRAESAGAYLHMLPDFDNTLKWYDNEGGIPEIAVPWSMFGTSLDEANSLLAKGPVKTVLVRVPASGAMSSFVANVKYFTDGKSNTVITPDEFVEASDADHDGDKTFVYRNDMNDDGTINKNSSKNKVFNRLFERVSAEGMVKGTEQTLSLAPIKAVVDKWGFNKSEDYKLSDAVEVANVSEQMAFGNEAVGILAIASKMLSMLSQSKESLYSPINFGYEMTKDENGKTIGKLADMQELNSFTDKQIDDVARLLQAALDMGNDPILTSTGLNKYTIGVGTALSLLGQDLESVVGFLNNDIIVEFNKKLAATEGTFNNSSSANRSKKETLEEYMSTISPEVGVFSTKKTVEANETITQMNEDSPIKEGIFRTSEGKTYYSVSKIEGSGNKFSVEIIAELLDHEVSIMDKYNELQDVAKDIKKLIPLIQLDNKLPNTGTDLRNLKESFIDAKNLIFSTESLMSRPLMNHYKSVIQNESNIFNNKFITENEFFAGLDKLFKTSLPFGINSGKKIRDSFMHQVAQEQLTKKYSEPQEFIDKFSEEIKSMISSIRTGTVQHSLLAEDLEQVEFQIKAKEANEAAWQESLIGADKQWLAKYIPMMKEYQVTEDNFQEVLSYADNSFLKNISYKKNLIAEDGSTLTNLIQSKPEFRRATETIKKAVREDFFKLPQSMQDKFVDYQLLRHGLNDKIGSLMDMLPQDMKIKALVSMSKFSGNKKAHLDNNSDLIKRNTALSLFNEMTQDITTESYKEDQAISLTKAKYVKMGNELYEKVPNSEGIAVGNQNYTLFDKITNDEFVVGKDFVKFGKNVTSNEASQEAINEIDNNC